MKALWVLNNFYELNLKSQHFENHLIKSLYQSVSDFIFLGFKITADGNYSYEIKRYLLLGRKAVTNLDSVLKSRDINKKGLSSQRYVFSSSHV